MNRISHMCIMYNLYFICLCLYYHPSFACYIYGTDSGICTILTLDTSWKSINMPYCSGIVNYPACIPKEQYINPSFNFPQGRWQNYTILTKDQWIQNMTETYITTRENIESDPVLNTQGLHGHVVRRFYRRPDCRNSYKQLMCYINFPRCDMDRDISLDTCRSACENFFDVCNYERGLWRCGQSKYFNGYEPEVPTYDTNGNPIYMRDYFPGQPFRQNKYDKDGNEEPICTPAIKGSGVSIFSYSTLFFSISIMIITAISMM